MSPLEDQHEPQTVSLLAQLEPAPRLRLPGARSTWSLATDDLPPPQRTLDDCRSTRHRTVEARFLESIIR
ncbi:MAG TPA: hypothetical protein VG756_25650 [Pseudonocardiaceae bacterium]|jgi:hypothetical protein|nr:hypothetical protein [Pseudonocardiaceae bacterium]